jgi:hypothetical protein
LRKQVDCFGRSADTRPEHALQPLATPRRDEGLFVTGDKYVAPVLSVQREKHRIPELAALTVA